METRFHWFCVFQVILAYESIVLCKCSGKYIDIYFYMVGRLKDVHVFRGVAAGMSDHFLVEAEVVVAKEWGNRVVVCRREVVKVEELKKTEKKQEYQDKLKEAYDRVKEREAGVRGGMEVNERKLWGMQAMCVERGLLEVV